MPIADYSFGQAMWTMFVFFAWVIFIWLLIVVFMDLFRRHDIGGWGKFGWTIFVILLPYIGIFVYLIVEGKGMGERSSHEQRDAQAQMDSYVRSVAQSATPADQIAQAKQLLDSDAITAAEYEQLKACALAT